MLELMMHSTAKSQDFISILKNVEDCILVSFYSVKLSLTIQLHFSMKRAQIGWVWVKAISQQEYIC